MKELPMIETLLTHKNIDINKAWEIETSAVTSLPYYAGYTPLMLAIELGLETVVIKLLTMNAKLTPASVTGETALEILRDGKNFQISKDGCLLLLPNKQPLLMQ